MCVGNVREYCRNNIPKQCSHVHATCLCDIGMGPQKIIVEVLPLSIIARCSSANMFRCGLIGSCAIESGMCAQNWFLSRFLSLSLSVCIHSMLFSIRNWMIFLNERAPPLVFLMIAAGPSLTGMYHVQNYIDWEKFLWGLFAELVS